MSKGTSELTLIWTLETAWHGRCAESHGCGWRTGGDGEGVVFASLGGEETFGGCAVAFAFAVFLEGVLDGDGFVHEELTVHGFDGGVGGFEVGVGDEAVAF